MEFDEVTYAMGKFEEAASNLAKEINGLRGDLKPVVKDIKKHHDKLKDGEHIMGNLGRRIKWVFIWLAILTVIVIPQSWPAIKLLVLKLL